MASRVSAYVEEGYIVRVRPDVDTLVSSRRWLHYCLCPSV